MQALPTVFPWLCPLGNALELLYKQGIGITEYSPTTSLINAPEN